MKKYKKIIYTTLIILILGISIVLYDNHNLIFLSSKNKENLMNILEITEANSFKPISYKSGISFHGSDPDYFEIKFEISIEDYEKNNLNYPLEESYYEVLVDCHYKEKKDDNTYICILRVSELENIELFDRIKNFK